MKLLKPLSLALSISVFFGCSTDRELMKNARTIKFQRITISSNEGDLKFQTTNDLSPNVKPKMDRWYHWYQPHKLHKTAGNFSGRLLDGEYLSHFTDGELKEKGFFKDGLQSGKWMTWYENGQLKEVAEYKKGLKHGDYQSFDLNGNVMIQGVFKKGTYVGLKKSGWRKFIDFITFKTMRKGKDAE